MKYRGFEIDDNPKAEPTPEFNVKYSLGASLRISTDVLVADSEFSEAQVRQYLNYRIRREVDSLLDGDRALLDYIEYG